MKGLTCWSSPQCCTSVDELQFFARQACAYTLYRQCTAQSATDNAEISERIFKWCERERSTRRAEKEILVETGFERRLVNDDD